MPLIFAAKDSPNAWAGFSAVSSNETAAAPASSDDFKSLIDSVPVGIWTTSPQGAYQFINQRWLDFTGRAEAEEQACSWQERLHGEDAHQAAQHFAAALNGRTKFEGEYRLLRQDGEYRWLLIVALPRFEPDGTFLGFVATCSDISESKRAQLDLEEILAIRFQAHAQLAEQTNRLNHLADTDPLTNILNRRSFREQCDREWSRAVRHKKALACIMLDVDFFKKVNDTYGHSVGDTVLTAVAACLVKQCRPSDLVCRFGGEEFCILCPESTEAGAANLAERLREAVSTITINEVEPPLHVTCSLGVADRTSAIDNIDHLIERADEALRAAKRTGRNRVMRYVGQDSDSDSHRDGSPSQILSQITAADLMAPTPVIDCRNTIGEAIEILLDNKVGSAPVADQDGNLVGFISERDLMGLYVSSATWSRGVHEVMATNVIGYDGDTPCDEIYRFLCRVSIHRVVIVRDGRPIGVISPSSLLTHCRGHVQQVSDSVS